MIVVMMDIQLHFIQIEQKIEYTNTDNIKYIINDDEHNTQVFIVIILELIDIEELKY